MSVLVATAMSQRLTNFLCACEPAGPPFQAAMRLITCYKTCTRQYCGSLHATRPAPGPAHFWARAAMLAACRGGMCPSAAQAEGDCADCRHSLRPSPMPFRALSTTQPHRYALASRAYVAHPAVGLETAVGTANDSCEICVPASAPAYTLDASWIETEAQLPASSCSIAMCMLVMLRALCYCRHPALLTLLRTQPRTCPARQRMLCQTSAWLMMQTLATLARRQRTRSATPPVMLPPLPRMLPRMPPAR